MDDKFQDLLKRYNEGNVSASEKMQVERWYLSIGRKQKSIDKQELTSHFLEGQSELKQLYKAKSVFPLWKMVAASAAVLAFVLGIYLFQGTSGQKEQTLVARDSILPGEETAVLITDDGRDLNLKDLQSGSKITQGDIEIEKLADGKIKINQINNEVDLPHANVIRTPKGGEFEITLPDGSIVKLNADSELKFYSAYNKNDRQVNLTGEAFFDVQKSLKPFVVTAKNQKVTVLGTRFNIKAYADEQETVTKLLRGSVKVSSSSSGKEVLMSPGDQVVNKGNDLVLTSKQKQNVDWVEKEIVFNEKNIEEIMNDIARWYNVEVQFEDPELKSKTFSGTISRYTSFNKVIEVLEKTESLKFEIEGRKIIVKEL